MTIHKATVTSKTQQKCIFSGSKVWLIPSLPFQASFSHSVMMLGFLKNFLIVTNPVPETGMFLWLIPSYDWWGMFLWLMFLWLSMIDTFAPFSSTFFSFSHDARISEEFLIVTNPVPETGMFLWMPSLLISGGPLLSLMCLAWVRHCHRLLVEVVDWCASWLASLSAIGSFWWQAVQGVCSSAAHLQSVSETYLLCLQVEWGQAPLVRLGPLCGL